MRAFHVVIPARYASTRLPGKPLLPLAGRPMIEHVCARAWDSGAESVVVATDDDRIATVVAGFGAECCMTPADLPSGTDRIAEVARQKGWGDSAVVVNLQGDEPLMPSALLDQVAADLDCHAEASVATISARLENAAQVFDPNLVKVVCDAAGYALYFSRAPIPWDRAAWDKIGDQMGFAKRAEVGPESYAHMRRHIGLYAYRAGFLRAYVSWAPAPIERAEALEQLRALWHGHRIHVSEAEHAPPAGVDTAADLQRVTGLLSGDH